MSRAEASSHAERAARIESDWADLMYEDALKACRREGHDFLAFITSFGGELLECRRCETKFEEIV